VKDAFRTDRDHDRKTTKAKTAVRREKFSAFPQRGLLSLCSVDDCSVSSLNFFQRDRCLLKFLKSCCSLFVVVSNCWILLIVGVVESDRYVRLGLEFDWTVSLMAVGCVVLFGDVLDGENRGFQFGRRGLDEVGQ